jgi:hypothetical protein
MLQSLWKTDLSGLEGRANFVTLTYPANWPPSAPEWKAHLDAFDKRFHRKYPDGHYYWKLEPQKRGAPHFHLLVFGPERIDRKWLKDAWFEIVGSNDVHHWHFGAYEQKLKSWKQVGAYCSKYCAKTIEDDSWGEPGRYWGIKRRENRKENVQRVPVNEVELFKVRRLFKRLIRAANGYRAPGGAYSGVWVRCSNQTAKKALTWAARASWVNPLDLLQIEVVYDAVRDRRAPDSGSSSTYAPRGARQSYSDHKTHKTNMELYDELDVQRRRILAWH